MLPCLPDKGCQVLKILFPGPELQSSGILRGSLSRKFRHLGADSLSVPALLNHPGGGIMSRSPVPREIIVQTEKRIFGYGDGAGHKFFRKENTVAGKNLPKGLP